jgi:hypothetical protein
MGGEVQYFLVAVAVLEAEMAVVFQHRLLYLKLVLLPTVALAEAQAVHLEFIHPVGHLLLLEPLEVMEWVDCYY